MNFFQKIWRWIRSLGQRRVLKQEIDEELRFHVEMRTAENIAAGMSPEEAARLARKCFGNLQSVREECRDVRGASFGEEVVQDFRFGLRMLRKNPAFTTVAVLTLALGIGACTAMFCVVNAVLLRSLPFSHPDRLVWIENIGVGGLSERTINAGHLHDWREHAQAFTELGGYFAFFDYLRYTLTDAGEPQRLRGVAVTQSFLKVLGVQPTLGRNFVDEECVFNGRPAVILSHAFWRQRFGSDTSIVGKSLTIDGKSTAVIGVLPADFDFDAVFAPGQDAQILLPFPLTIETVRQGNTLFAIGRLKPDATLDQAQSEIDTICQHMREQRPENGRFGARLTMLEDKIRGPFRSAFYLLFGAVLCVLLIACVNLSNLLLARANARRKEFAVRVALGANRWRLARQTMTESLLLATMGCAAGIPLAFVVTNALSGMQTFGIPLLQNVEVNGTVLAFTLLVSVFAGLLCGILPALSHSGNGARETLNDAGTRRSMGRTAAWVRRTLVISEVALACVLLIGAGLLIRSFTNVLNVNLGFQPKHAVSWRVDTTTQFNSPEERVQYYNRLVEHVATLPGIESVGLTDTLPLGRNRQFGAGAKGVDYPRGQYPVAFPRMVDERYLQTMRIPLLAGRYFDARDKQDSTKVIIINQAMARKLWPGENAIGKYVVVGWSKVPEHLVVGVAADVRHGGLEEAPQNEIYLNFRQRDDWAAVDMVVRSDRVPASFIADVRAAIRQFDPVLPSTEFTTLDDVVNRAIASRRLFTGILSAFSSLALLLAVIGLYGVIAYSVSLRTHEMGIRLAVGAQRWDVLRLILGEGLKVTLAGVGIGLVAAFFASRLLANQLYGVTATDPVIFAANALILTAVSLVACFIPARRAAKVDPIVALRYE